MQGGLCAPDLEAWEVGLEVEGLVGGRGWRVPPSPTQKKTEILENSVLRRCQTEVRQAPGLAGGGSDEQFTEN
jgi:hypothetical protein